MIIGMLLVACWMRRFICMTRRLGGWRARLVILPVLHRAACLMVGKANCWLIGKAYGHRKARFRAIPSLIIGWVVVCLGGIIFLMILRRISRGFCLMMDDCFLIVLLVWWRRIRMGWRMCMSLSL